MQKRKHLTIRDNIYLLSGFLVLISLIMGACGSASGSAGVSADPTMTAFNRQLQSQIEAKMQAMRVPGAVIYVQSQKTGEWTSSIGVSDIATKEAMRPDMHFRIGSITKTLTGTVILQLVDEGKLKLNDPLSKYQPDVPNSENVTIRQLLDMRSGLYNYSEDNGFDKALEENPRRVWRPQELVAISNKHQPYFAPGKDFHYSNTNTILLGMIIEQITGRSVEQEMQSRIFAPLGMQNSQMPALTSNAIMPPPAQGYILDSSLIANTEMGGQADDLVNVTSWNPSWGWTAGAAISTVEDLKLWAKALATGKLLSSATQKERLTWETSISPDLKYGLAIADFYGYIGHNGQLPGYQSFEGYKPDGNSTIIVLTNLYEAPDGAKPADALAELIAKNVA